MLPENLHDALVDIVRFGQDGGPGMFLEKVVVDTQVRQEYGKIEPATPSANDDNRHILGERHPDEIEGNG
jgi:hypothetical protein